MDVKKKARGRMWTGDTIDKSDQNKLGGQKSVSKE